MVSVIVPVYNAELTLKQCVDSILSQEITDFELLLIDDGSTDQSPIICDEYAKQDLRIRVFHKDNGGVSSARNLGLENAQGEWITFIDSDDYITKDFLPDFDMIDTDMVFCSYRSFLDKKISDYRSHEILSVPQNFNEFINKFITDPVLRGPVSKFFKKDIILSLRFPVDMKTGEDTYFVLYYVSRCRNYSILENGCYMIRSHMVSYAHRYSMSVEYAADSLLLLKNAFEELRKNFDVDLSKFASFIGYFKYLSKNDWENNQKKWYENTKIKKLYAFVWPYVSIRTKLSLIMSRIKNTIF